MRFAISLILVLPVSASPEDSGATVNAIIVFASQEWTELRSISISELRQIYLGRRRSLAGESIEAYDLPAGHPARRLLERRLLRMSEKEVRDYWIKQALTGGDLPPREGRTPEVVTDAVSARPGRLGYMDEATWARVSSKGLRMVPIRLGNSTLVAGDGDYPLKMKPK